MTDSCCGRRAGRKRIGLKIKWIKKPFWCKKYVWRTVFHTHHTPSQQHHHHTHHHNHTIPPYNHTATTPSHGGGPGNDWIIEIILAYYKISWRGTAPKCPGASGAIVGHVHTKISTTATTEFLHRRYRKRDRQNAQVRRGP